MSSANNPNFNYNLHGSRGLLSFSLFFFHVVNSGLPKPEIDLYRHIQTIFMSFQHSVELFFVISGIVIVGASRRSPTILHFMMDRASRIYPVLWASIIVVAILKYFGDMLPPQHDLMEAAITVLCNAFALTPVIHAPTIHPAAWSLSYEMFFYAIVAMFMLLQRLIGWRWSVIICLFIFILIFFGHARAMFFLPGVAIGLGLGSLAPETAKKFPILWISLFLLSWTIWFELAGGVMGTNSLGLMASDPALPVLMIVAMGSAFMAMAGICEGYGVLSAVLRTPAFQWLGTISYSLYLWQTPVMAVVKRMIYLTGTVDVAGAWSQPILFALALLPTLFISAVSQKYLEASLTRKIRLQWSRHMTMTPQRST